MDKEIIYSLNSNENEWAGTMVVDVERSHSVEWQTWVAEVDLQKTSASLRLGQVGPLSWVLLSRCPCTLEGLLHPASPVPGPRSLGRAFWAEAETIDLPSPTTCCTACKVDQKPGGTLDCASLGLRADGPCWLSFLEQDWAASRVLTHNFGQLKDPAKNICPGPCPSWGSPAVTYSDGALKCTN